MSAFKAPAMTRRWSFTQSTVPPVRVPVPVIYRLFPSMRTVPPESRTSCATVSKRSDSFKRRRAPLMKEDSPSMEQAKLDRIGNKSGICSKFTWIG